MFPCFLQDNNWLISFFIIYSAKNSLYFMTNFHASCFNQTFRKIKINSFWFCYFVGLFFVIITSIVITTRLNCCKVFWWYDHSDKKDRVIVSFHFFGLWNLFSALICANKTGGLATNLIFKSLNYFTYRPFLLEIKHIEILIMECLSLLFPWARTISRWNKNSN